MNKNISVIVPRMNGKRLAVMAKAIQLAKEGNRVAIYDMGGKVITFEPNKKRNKSKEQRTMTRNEAIQIIENMPISHECREFFNVALEALKQPQIVLCKDCGYSFFKEGLVLPGHIICTKLFTERWQAVKPDNWFCADGIAKNT